jgi:hypothetical protein
MLCDLIRMRDEQGEARFEIDVKRGGEWWTDGRTDAPLPRADAIITWYSRSTWRRGQRADADGVPAAAR